ncbi:DNA primase [Burkholderiales bacterium 8X]|nr:DNA primase [Burkholderiales bacterium 8X]
MTIPAAFIQELIARADVVEIVGRYVPLKKSGANFSGLCPFHSEKSPSFSVSPTKQFYHCFGCGVHGNAIGFLMEHGGMGFVEAVHDLAQQYGLQVPEDDASPEERARAAGQRQKQATLSEVLQKAAEAYRKQLRQSKIAIDYLKRRGVSGEVAKLYGIGYAPPGWRSLASVFPGYDDPLLVESGLVIAGDEVEGEDAKRYDRFRDRIMFPIRNVKGEHIGFGGRVLGDEKPKYLNSPETPVFSKGRELYGLFEARSAFREHGFALVTEGYMDVVALAQLGFPNAVASLGTACTPEHVQKLFRFTESVVFSFDGDAAGRRAARKALDSALPFATDVRSIKFLFLPSEHDPDTYIREFGNEAFDRCIKEATPLSRFMLEAAADGCDLGSAEGRARMTSNARPLWTALPAGALKQQLLVEISQKVQLDSSALLSLWPAAGNRSRPRPPDPDAPARSSERDSGPFEDYGASASQDAPDFGDFDGGFVRNDSRRGDRGWRGKSREASAPRGRSLPFSRADVAARLLLSNVARWEALSHELHELLCALPGEHGELFRWLDHQLLEHGRQPWAALREGLRGQAFEALVLRAMAATDAAPAPEDGQAEAQQEADALRELRSVLDFMLDDQLKLLQNEAIAAVGSDPTALERYKALEARRLDLRARLNTAVQNT